MKDANEMKSKMKEIEEEFNNERLKNINEAKAFYIQSQQDLQKQQKINELAKANFIDTVKQNSLYEGILISPKYIDAVNKYLKDEKDDPEAAKLNDVDKSVYKMMNDELSSDRWFNSKIKIVEIIRYGYTSYCVGIKFTVNQSKNLYQLTLPDSSKIDASNFMYADEGKMTLGCWKHDSLLEIVESSYDKRDIIKAFNEIIKK